MDVNVYVYRAGLLCEKCGESKRKSLSRVAPAHPEDESSYDSDHYPKGPFAPSSADAPQHCDHCGAFLANPLTSDGYEYVREKCREARRTGRDRAICLVLWAPFYNVTLDEEPNGLGH